MKQSSFKIGIIILNISIILFFIYLARHQKEGYLDLRREDGRLFTESLKHNFENFLIAKEKTQGIFADKLVVAAKSIIYNRDTSSITQSELSELSNRLGIFRMLIIREGGTVQIATRGGVGKNLLKEFKDVIEGKEKIKVGGLHQSLRSSGYRFVVGHHLPQGGALILIDEGDEIQDFFETISYENVLEHLGKNRGLEYISYKKGAAETGSILSFPPNFYLDTLSSEEEWSVLDSQNTSPSPIFMRFSKYKNRDILEFKTPITHGDQILGNLRVGLSLAYIERLQSNLFIYLAIGILLMLMLNGLFLFSARLLNRIGQEGNQFRWVLEGLKDGILIEQPGKPLLKNPAFEQILPGKESEHTDIWPMGLSHQHIKDRDFLVLRSKMDQTMLTLIRDTTLQDIAEQSRRREEKLFSMGQLTSSFAHEIRNPLNTISMTLQQVDTSPLNPNEKDYLKIVSQEIIRLNQTVQQFLQLSRQPELKCEFVDIKPFLRDLAVFYAPRFQESSAQLDLNLNENLPSPNLDRDQVRGVLVNLIENSLQADATQVILKTELDEGFLVISVTDNGIGMDDQTSKKAFDLYFTTRQEGSGLGLPYVQRIVSAHNGLLRLHSKKASGTEIELYFPVEVNDET